MPSIQPQYSASPSMAGPVPVSTQSGAMPMVQQVEVTPPKKKDVVGLVKTIVIIILSLIAVTFIGLFIWMFIQYNDANNDLEGKINYAVAEAKDEQGAIDVAKCNEEKKYEYKNFAGPVDYGELTFQYPKTWSVFIEKDASTGGDFTAYLNPGQVDPISNTNVDALRVTIYNQSFDKIVEKYQREMNRKDAPLSMESVTVNGVTANRYSGTIPGTQFQGYILIFKIRDKTAELRTDSVLFEDDYNKIIETIKFNA